MSGDDTKNNPDNNYHLSKNIYGKGEGTHFSSEELLTYLHQHDRGDNIWQVMHQHMLSCPACRRQVAELERAEYLFKSGLSANKNISYSPIAASVLKQIYEQQQTGAPLRFKAKGSVRLSVTLVAVVAVVLFALTVSSIWFNRTSTFTGFKPVSTPIPTIGGIPQQQQTPTPTVISTTTPGPIATTPVQQTLAFTECTMSFDEVKQHLRICGSNFKAGDNLVFTLVDSKGRMMKQIGPIQIANDGTFSQNITIHSCKDVPSIIYAQDTSVKKTEVVVELTNIWYKNC